MTKLISSIKQFVETKFNLRIYRDTLPHGADLFRDLAKYHDLKQIRSVIDIGVHQGQSTNAYLKFFPHSYVIGFEPCEESFKLMQSKFSGNPRVKIVQEAVSNYDGMGTLFLNPASPAHSLTKPDDSVGEQEVRVTTFDQVCQHHGINHVDFLKIDTEGHDLNVLKGASVMLQERKIDFVQVETSVRNDVSIFSPFAECNSLLTGYGYEIFGFYDQQTCWSGRPSMLYFNAVYISSNLVGNLPVR